MQSPPDLHQGHRKAASHAGVLAKTFAETLESRGESGLIGVRLVMIAVLARAVAHRFDTRGFAAIATGPPPESRADHTD